jgi:predicted dienelactone hydrolase
MIASNSGRALLFAIGLLFAAGALGVAALLVMLRIEHGTPLELPQPSGPFAVGRTSFHWVNSDQLEDFAPSKDTRRELIAWVWYPAGTRGTPAHYLPQTLRESFEKAGGVLMAGYLTRDLAKVGVHASENTALAAAPAKFPVVILRAGAAALVPSYTVIAEDLASRGYIVVGPDAAYRTTVVVLPDGRVISRPPEGDLERVPSEERPAFAEHLMQSWSSDVGFVIDQLAKLDSGDPADRFTGRLDLTRIGIVGHSLGGATAAHFCHEDVRCRAGVDLDGQLFGPVIDEGLSQPFLFVLEDESETRDPAASQILAHIESMYQHLPVDSRLQLSMAGANHFSFSDQILLKSQWLLRLLRGLGVIGGLDGPRGLRITSDCIGAFLAVHLKGDPPAELDALAATYPELRIHR